MPDFDANGSSRIFISYRRDETAYPASWLYDRLKTEFGGAQVFKDVDNIEPGDDFVDTITRAVESCDVLLAIIGPDWATVTDTRGRRRIDDPGDFVRLEVEPALNRNVRVIPLLVDHAEMPDRTQLPEPLAPLVRRHAFELSPSHFMRDAEELLIVLSHVLTPAPTVLRDPEPVPAPAPPPPWPMVSPGSARAAPMPPRGTAAPEQFTTARWIRTALIGAACLVVIAGLIIVADRWLQPDETASPTSDGFSPPPSIALPQAKVAMPADELIWRRERDNEYAIVRVGLDGTEGKVLARTKKAYAAALTPDRRTLLYLLRDDEVGSPMTLRAKSIDGDGDRALFADRSPSCPILTQPAIRSDGLLAVVCEEFDGSGALNLMTLDGQIVRVLARGYVADPTFTRDGRSVVYSRAPRAKARGGTLIKVSCESGAETVITDGAVDTDPVSAPHSDVIAFRRISGVEKAVIALVDPSNGPNSKPTELTAIGDYAGPSWSPDGTQIAIRRGPEKGNGAVQVMNADGTGARPIVANDGYASVPLWTAH